MMLEQPNAQGICEEIISELEILKTQGDLEAVTNLLARYADQLGYTMALKTPAPPPPPPAPPAPRVPPPKPGTGSMGSLAAQLAAAAAERESRIAGTESDPKLSPVRKQESDASPPSPPKPKSLHGAADAALMIDITKSKVKTGANPSQVIEFRRAIMGLERLVNEYQELPPSFKRITDSPKRDAISSTIETIKKDYAEQLSDEHGQKATELNEKLVELGFDSLLAPSLGVGLTR